MSAFIYPLRMNSKYQSEIEQLENMGFDGNEAAQFLEENDGNVVRAVEQLLQNEYESNDSEDESSSDEEQYNDQNGEQNGEEDIIAENNNNNNNNNSIIYDLNQIVDEMMKDFSAFCSELPINMLCSKLMLFIWCVIIVIIPIIISIHNGHCNHSIKHNYKSNNNNILKNGYIQLVNDNSQYLSLDLFNKPILTSNPSNKDIKRSIWKLEIDKNNDIKLQNTMNNKYLRVYDKHIDCDGNGDIYSIFKLYNNNNNHYSVILETYSNSKSKKYLSHTRRWWDTRKCNKYLPYRGYDNRYCIHISHSHRNYRSQWIIKYIDNNNHVEIPSQQIIRDFDTIYDFEDDVLFNNDDVIIKHMYHYDAYMQSMGTLPVTDDIIAKHEIINNNGIWNIEKIKIENDEKMLIKLKNKFTGKYLRIIDNKVNIGGTGGKYTLFEITIIEAQNHNLKAIRLQSVHYPGNYIVIRSNGEINVTDNCNNDIDCVLIFLTTKRSKDLINLKNEIKIIQLQKEIKELKLSNTKCNDGSAQSMLVFDDHKFDDLNLDEFFIDDD